MTAASLNLEGRLLGGRYRVDKLLGAGGMGAVYSAVQEDLKRRVAVKVLFGELSVDDVMRFRQEALAAAALGHPNIVQVTDFQAPPGDMPFLVMEALEGQSLKTLIERRGVLPPHRVVFIAVQMLAALAAAHAERIIHRDIKPGNVFLSRTPAANDFVKILDFGIAKREGTQGPQTAMGLILGTPAYMAPEQALGLVVDHRTDLYAVGACMYLMLSGRRPLDAATSGELLVAIARQVPAPLATLAPQVDGYLAALIDRTLSKAPGARPQSALEMIEELAPWARSAVGRVRNRPGDISGELVHANGQYVQVGPEGAPRTAAVATTHIEPGGATLAQTGGGTQPLARPLKLPAPPPSYPTSPNLSQPSSPVLSHPTSPNLSHAARRPTFPPNTPSLQPELLKAAPPRARGTIPILVSLGIVALLLVAAAVAFVMMQRKPGHALGGGAEATLVSAI